MGKDSSAVADLEPLEVLVCLHNNFDLCDMAGPVEVLQAAQHNMKDDSTKAFEITLVADEPACLSRQGVMVKAQLSYKEAYENLADYDIVVVLGGGIDGVLKAGAEPLGLIKAYADMQEESPTQERTLMSICTGSLLLAQQGLLLGLKATTHPDYIVRLENLCSQAAVRELDERTDVLEDVRYVVNNLRFDVGEKDENPYVYKKGEGRKPVGRKGSMSLKDSKSEDAVDRRLGMRLGGLRIITSSGVSAGVDAALYLVGAMVDIETAEEVARIMCWNWTKGEIVGGLDV